MSECIGFDGSIHLNDDGKLAVNYDGETIGFNIGGGVVPYESIIAMGTWKAFPPRMFLGSMWGIETSVGNGSFTGRYIKLGTQVFFTAKYVFGTTTSFQGGTGLMHFSPPLSPATGYDNDNGMRHSIMQGQVRSTNGVGYIRPMDFTVPYGAGYSILSESDALFTDASPAGWGAGSFIEVMGWYRTWD